MKQVTISIILAALALAPAVPAEAGPKKNCPPGLAKKNPPCVPPGQAKKGVTPGMWLNRGDRFDWDRYPDYHRLRERDWRRYRLPDIAGHEGYYTNGHMVYRIDRDTRRVIDWILLTDDILND